ncbi:MAG: rhamnose:proton symporter [Cyclobacteriaceae bacterium]|nr:rhamnose:proton symporter [Cyclobacteriaceae bacterium]
MITPNPIIGTGLHAIGGISASSCYLPFHKTNSWSWGSYWLVQAAFAWLIMPVIIGIITVPHLFLVLRNSPTPALVIPFVLGALYGFGGLSFGYAIRHIGFSLTYTISIGISAVLGTITPLIINGNLIEHFQKPGGLIVLTGMMVSILGVALCGSAGYKKEKDLSKIQGSNSSVHFNMKKGLALSIFAGVLSAVFGISLEYGQPISDLAAQYGAGHFEGNSKIIVSTAGCFVTNFIWFLILGIKQGTIKEILQTKKIGTKSFIRNYIWSAFGGSLWYFQFFFYGLGHVRMGNFMFASWVIHMSMLIFFSYLVGVLMKEWKNVSRNTYAMLIIALITLILSFVIMTIGTVKGENETNMDTWLFIHPIENGMPPIFCS